MHTIATYVYYKRSYGLPSFACLKVILSKQKVDFFQCFIEHTNFHVFCNSFYPFIFLPKLSRISFISPARCRWRGFKSSPSVHLSTSLTTQFYFFYLSPSVSSFLFPLKCETFKSFHIEFQN